YNEYVTSADGAIGTDWVLTFPTKRFYVDAQAGGAIAGEAVVFAPFEEFFGANNPGQSCISLITGGPFVFNREEGFGNVVCPFECPPLPPQQALCLATNVVRFADTSVLGSAMPAQSLTPFGDAGIVQLALTEVAHDAYPAANGNVFHGLPATGFA